MRDHYRGRGGKLEADADGNKPHWQHHLDERDLREFSTDPRPRPDPHLPDVYVPRIDRDTGDVLTGKPCHPDSQWTCLGCEAVLCRWCDGIPGDESLCWLCINTEDPEGPEAA